MAKLNDWADPLHEVEALVRSAGTYIHASEDLRPRVLETARVQCGEQRARCIIRQFTLALVLWGLCATSGLQHSDIKLAQQHTMSDRILMRAEAKAAQTGDYGGGLVDAFLELRRHQAEVLRLAL